METEREVRLMKRLFAATLLLFFLEGSNQIISAQTREARTLRGLRGVVVAIVGIDSDAKKADLTESQLKTDVEVELRKAGIPVVTSGEAYLIVYVNSVAISVSGVEGLYVFCINVTLKQIVDLRRNRSIGAFAATWDKAYVAGVGKSHFKKSVREKVRDYVNDFINDYLTVNPK